MPLFNSLGHTFFCFFVCKEFWEVYFFRKAILRFVDFVGTKRKKREKLEYSTVFPFFFLKWERKNHHTWNFKTWLMICFVFVQMFDRVFLQSQLVKPQVFQTSCLFFLKSNNGTKEFVCLWDLCCFFFFSWTRFCFLSKISSNKVFSKWFWNTESVCFRGKPLCLIFDFEKTFFFSRTLQLKKRFRGPNVRCGKPTRLIFVSFKTKVFFQLVTREKKFFEACRSTQLRSISFCERMTLFQPPASEKKKNVLKFLWNSDLESSPHWDTNFLPNWGHFSQIMYTDFSKLWNHCWGLERRKVSPGLVFENCYWSGGNTSVLAQKKWYCLFFVFFFFTSNQPQNREAKFKRALR